MPLVALRRSLVAAATITLLTIPSAFAETVDADHDIVTAGIQNTVDLGTVDAGADVPVDVYFTLTCSGTSHVDATQAIKLTPATRIVPNGGGFSMTTVVFGLGAGWPADGEACPANLRPTVGGPLHMIVTAPTDPGDNYTYVFSWTPTVIPTSADDTGVFGTLKPTITFILDVAGPTGTPNTPPTLTVPAGFTVEGNRIGGATAAYTVSASDAEDTTAPTPACSPAVGSLLTLGANTITCSVLDSDGATDTGSFVITVVDTAAPTLHGMPGDRSMTTSDPSGATLTYTKPTASDVVDSSPVVSCAPASGSLIPVGDTTVRCTATDDSGNQSSDSFRVHVTLAQAVWDDPVGASAGIVVNGSRTIPVKVVLLLDGRAVTAGTGLLTVSTCGGSVVATDDLAVQSNARWMGHLSTDGLAAGCYRVVASVDGRAIGSFGLDVRGGSIVATTKPAKANAKP